MDDDAATLICGGLTGLGGVITYERVNEYLNARDAVFQAALAKAQDITPEAYLYASEAVKMVPQEDLYLAFLAAIVTGVSLGITIYAATRPDE